MSEAKGMPSAARFGAFASSLTGLSRLVALRASMKVEQVSHQLSGNDSCE